MHEFPETIVLVGVPVAVLAALVVEALKEAGLPVRWAPLVAVLVSGAFIGMVELAEVVSWIDPLSRVVAGSLVIGLASSGGYSWARAVGKRAGNDE